MFAGSSSARTWDQTSADRTASTSRAFHPKPRWQSSVRVFHILATRVDPLPDEVDVAIRVTLGREPLEKRDHRPPRPLAVGARALEQEPNAGALGVTRSRELRLEPHDPHVEVADRTERGGDLAHAPVVVPDELEVEAAAEVPHRRAQAPRPDAH